GTQRSVLRPFLLFVYCFCHTCTSALITIVAVMSAALMATAAIMATLRTTRRGTDGFLDRIEALVKNFAFGGFSDIDAPSGKFCGKASILPIFANGKRQLLLRNSHESGMIRIAKFHLERLHWTERVSHKGSGFGAPLDDIDFLIVQFVHNVIDARSTNADARTD